MRQIEHNGEESDPENQREKLELMKLQFSQKMAVLQGQKLNIDDELENVGHCRIHCICAFLMIEIFIDLMQKSLAKLVTHVICLAVFFYCKFQNTWFYDFHLIPFTS